jgi:hypothetical protein
MELVTERERQIEDRLTVEELAEAFPAIASMSDALVEAVDVIRSAAGTFTGLRLNIDADPLDPSAIDARNEMQEAIDALKRLADRYE